MARIPPKVRQAVLARDRGCVATALWAHACRDAFGGIHPSTDLRRLELDHVREDPQMGETAPSEPEYLVALCSYAHQASGFATANRPVLRAYLELRCAGEPISRIARALRPSVVPPRTAALQW